MAQLYYTFLKKVHVMTQLWIPYILRPGKLHTKQRNPWLPGVAPDTQLGRG